MFQGTDQREVSQGGDVSCEVRRLEFGEHVTRDACKESRDQRLVRKRRRRKNYSLVQCMHLGKKNTENPTLHKRFVAAGNKERRRGGGLGHSHSSVRRPLQIGRLGEATTHPEF
jgi:hypothetical protein